MVIDSVNGRYLSGAEVIIQGANLTLTTDSSGKFKVDSLMPGTYVVRVINNKTQSFVGESKLIKL